MLLVFLPPLLPACQPKVACTVTSDCATGQTCVNQHCVVPASSCPGGASSCTAASECTSGVCANGCCSPGCLDSAECGDGGSCVNGVCQSGDAGPGDGVCTSDSDCTGTDGGTPWCNTDTSSCVQCLSTADCGGNPNKSCVGNACVYNQGTCGQNSDCASTPTLPVCDTTQSMCVGCLTNADCPNGQDCTPLEVCQTPAPATCSSDADCRADGGTGATPHCDTSSGTCVQCLTTAQCPVGDACEAEVCETMAPCQADFDCVFPGLTHCDTSTEICVQCTDPSQCLSGQNCVNDACTVCTSDTDCTTSAIGPHCDTTTGGCAVCTESSECPGNQVCTADTCCVAGGQCCSDADCANNINGDSYCLVSTGMCVQCRVSSQCVFGLFCQHNVCGQFMCQGDSDCVGNSAGGVCDTSNGQCVQCTSTETSACTGGLVCQANVCSPMTCATDLDCASNATGTHCDAVSQTCVQCAQDSDCTAGQSCLAGKCAADPACMHTADCTVATDVCVPFETGNYTAWTERCVAGSTAGTVRGGAACGADGDCISGSCLFLTGNTTDGICLTACTSASDCDPTAQCPAHGVLVPVPGPGGETVDAALPPAPICWPQACTTDLSCYMAGVNHLGRVCSPLPDPQNPTTAAVLSCLPTLGIQAGGTPCGVDSDCASGMCLTWKNATDGHTALRCFGACTAVGTEAGCDGMYPTDICRAGPVDHGGEMLSMSSCEMPVP